jgi:hypothetical protein
VIGSSGAGVGVTDNGVGVEVEICVSVGGIGMDVTVSGTSLSRPLQPVRKNTIKVNVVNLFRRMFVIGFLKK